MSEKLVKEALKKYLTSIGAYYYMPVSLGYGSTAIDFFVCHKGRFYGIETKREEIPPEPTARQYIVMHYITEAGGSAWVENSLDLETTRRMLQ